MLSPFQIGSLWLDDLRRNRTLAAQIRSSGAAPVLSGTASAQHYTQKGYAPRHLHTLPGVRWQFTGDLQ